jgi:hypothetical protein
MATARFSRGIWVVDYYDANKRRRMTTHYSASEIDCPRFLDPEMALDRTVIYHCH